MNLQYAVQSCLEGQVQASIVGGWFTANDSSTLVVGVYIIHCRGLPLLRSGADARTSGATVFAYKVQDLERYGSVAFDQQRNVSFPKSNTSSAACTHIKFRWLTSSRRSSPSP